MRHAFRLATRPSRSMTKARPVFTVLYRYINIHCLVSIRQQPMSQPHSMHVMPFLILILLFSFFIDEPLLSDDDESGYYPNATTTAIKQQRQQQENT
jgi:hypothetical protein